ncbi:MAG: hypothetical protein RL885_14560 [Planctomycetota bacterium]
MVRDTIVEEVRAAREAFAKQHDYDIDAIVKALQEASAKVGRELVSLPARTLDDYGMPSHKTLKSVVASLAQSFTSLMNYRGDDSVMGHLVHATWSSGSTRLRVDLLSGETDASALKVPEVRKSVAEYVGWFPDRIRRSNSSIDFVIAAELVVTVDPTVRRSVAAAEFMESLVKCTVRVTDDRGKAYVHEIKDWWCPEKAPPEENQPWRRLW